MSVEKPIETERWEALSGNVFIRGGTCILVSGENTVTLLGIERAKLAAAAPTMFEVLEEALEYFEQRQDADQPSGCDHPIPNEEMKFAVTIRAALAKAKA